MESPNSSGNGMADTGYIFTKSFFLAAGDTDYTAHLPLPMLLRRVIEVATLHANRLGIGYANLRPMGIGWVLSRLAVKMERWPGPNETYTFRTWVEGWTRMYSDRCFEISDGEGRVIGHVRTLWVCIDFRTRGIADLSALHGERYIAPEQPEMPVDRLRKLPSVSLSDASVVRDHRFSYCELDFNGHVNTVRYAEAVLNLWPPQVYASNTVTAFEMDFLLECHYDEQIAVAAIEMPGDGMPEEDAAGVSAVSRASVSLLRDGTPVVNARVTFESVPGAPDAIDSEDSRDLRERIG